MNLSRFISLFLLITASSKKHLNTKIYQIIIMALTEPFKL